jgi:SAM-dependent methyltransferase
MPTNTFDLFKKIVTDYDNKSILDFGGNHGNLLKTSDGSIKDYTCLDISETALALLPANAKSIHWNRYHPSYNLKGFIDEPFPVLDSYDIVFSNSVFTHHPIDEMFYCIRHLMQYTDNLYFTYVDPNNLDFFEGVKQYKPIYISDDILQKHQSDSYYYILDHRDIVYDLPAGWNDLWLMISKNKIDSMLRDIDVEIYHGKAKWLNYAYVRKTS